MDGANSATHVWIFLNIIQTALCQCSGSRLTIQASESPTKFESPGYPTSYTNNENCEWLIDSGVPGQSVILYSDYLNMDCAFGDFINIYDGSSTSNSTLQANLCGAEHMSNEYISSGRYILVQFTSDSVTVGQGFQITFVTAADTSGSGCTQEHSLNASTTPQYLTSQNFPAFYSSHSACRWLITASNSLSTVVVQVVWSDVEQDVACAYDKLIIYDGTYVCENQVLLTECTIRTSAEASPTVYTSSSDGVLITFSSDGSFNRHGFIIKYSENFVNFTTTTTQPITTTTQPITTTTQPTTTTTQPTTTTTQPTTTTTQPTTTTTQPTTTTTQPTTTTTQPTTTVAACAQLIKTITETRTVISIPLMAASAGAGAVFALGILATIWLIKYLMTRKIPKRGLLTIHSIAPLPARSTVFVPRQQTTVLSFV